DGVEAHHRIVDSSGKSDENALYLLVKEKALEQEKVFQLLAKRKQQPPSRTHDGGKPKRGHDERFRQGGKRGSSGKDAHNGNNGGGQARNNSGGSSQGRTGRNASSCKHCKQQVLYYKESEQAIRHLKKCAPFQELRHQFAFVYPFSDVLPLYNQKIYAKDTQQARQDGPDPRKRQGQGQGQAQAQAQAQARAETQLQAQTLEMTPRANQCPDLDEAGKEALLAERTKKRVASNGNSKRFRAKRVETTTKVADYERPTVIINGVFQLPYCADSGSDTNIISRYQVEQLCAVDATVTPVKLSEPVSSRAVGGAILTSTHAIDVRLTLNTAAGPVRCQDTKRCLIVETDEDEFLVGKPLLSELGIDIDRQLEYLASRGADEDDSLDEPDGIPVEKPGVAEVVVNVVNAL
ncbi:hypothetical protein PR002_g30174, partial [Phytophthora rubi]